MTFKTSVNIKFDIGNNELIERYIPTPSHAEAIKGILEGFTETSTDHSHMILGPYGTGKSLIANIVGTLVSKQGKELEVNGLLNKFSQVDDSIAKQIDKATKLDIHYLPILLSGNEGRFRQSIISAILKQLKQLGIEVVLPGSSSKILETVDLWKHEYPYTYEALTSRLISDNKEYESWMQAIKDQNAEEVKYFSAIYPALTSGASFEIGYECGFISQIEFLLSTLNKNSLGIFVVYDEFGRFLQGLSASQFNEAMQDIQDLAELANRVESLHFLLITHKSLRLYFNTNSEEYNREFQRIEKRFRHYLVKSDQATFLRIAEAIVSENLENKPKIPSDIYQYIQSIMRKFPLFPSINQTERDELVIKGMYPLHPVSLFLLPNLTRIFGQNERTLFTFLESKETGGLLNHIQKSKNYYLSYQLFDFFFPETNEYINEEITQHILLYKKALARMPDDLQNKDLVLNVTKFITLWNLCGLQNEQRLNNEFLSFATDIDSKQLEEMLAILSSNKIVRFNRINNYWELFSGSSVDLHERLENEKQLIKGNKISEMNVLYQNLPAKYYFPDRYNDDKGMTRFAKVELLLAKDLIDFKIHEDQKSSDLILYYVLFEEEINSETLLQNAKLISEQRTDLIFFFHPESVQLISKEILDYIALESLQRNKELNAEDKGIKEEIELLLLEAKYTIENYLRELSLFKEQENWCINGEISKVDSRQKLTEILSKKCYILYGETPQILSDSFNRNQVSGVQRNAAIKLIDQMLGEPQTERFGIVGNGPEYALYAAIFKNNDGLDQHVNQLDYTNIQNPHFAHLRTNLIEFLEQSPTGNLKEVVSLFMGSPFGIRKPLVPILLVALLRDRWSELMLYRNQMFVPGLDGSKLYEIIVELGAENYEYEYEQIDQNQLDFFNRIEVAFADSIEKRLENQSKLLYICGTLMKWLRSLPKVIQTTERASAEFQLLRDLIRRSEVQPQEVIARIYELYSNKFEDLLRLKYYAESYLESFQNELVEVMLDKAEVRTIDEFEGLVLAQKRNNNFSNKLTRHISTLGTTISDPQERMIIFAKNYIGVDIESWSDVTFDLFSNQLSYDLKQIYMDDAQQVDGANENKVMVQLNHEVKAIEKIELSEKSKSVYTNLERMVNSAGSRLPRQELEYLLYQLFENHVMK
ncbi:hypothetical protein [Saccharibacillus endophyticus]|uniref:ATP-binding protein n=1 Tax=Saccharibacillus endophyticus TaxID=2060666 RepID=A0ABQ1ZU86_9BACL|nr:hypothetical protein [Saccharibacillus endophyticus]GGH76746.1 hypothetical protein GCM10007362_19460 [Saccharibacillus endophyticus]